MTLLMPYLLPSSSRSWACPVWCPPCPHMPPVCHWSPTDIPCGLCKAQLGPSKLTWANSEWVKHCSMDRYQETARWGQGISFRHCLWDALRITLLFFELVWGYQDGVWMVQHPAVSFGASGCCSPPGFSFCMLKGGLVCLGGPGWLHSAPQTFGDMVLTTLFVRTGSIGQAVNEKTALQPQEWDFNKCDVESKHMPWSVVWIFWVACESMRSSRLMLEDGDRWR